MPLAGKAVLIRTAELFLQLGTEAIVLALPAAHFELWQQVADKHLPAAQQAHIHLCVGGVTRTDSVQNGLEALSSHLGEPTDCLVAIHDGVRPLIPSAIIKASYEQAAAHGASVVCVPVKASLRESDGSLSHPVDRSRFWEVQTPQTFRLHEILNCYRNRPEGKFTDDASLFQAMGGEVLICEGSYENLKLTTPEDMIVAERILERRAG